MVKRLKKNPPRTIPNSKKNLLMISGNRTLKVFYTILNALTLTFRIDKYGIVSLYIERNPNLFGWFFGFTRIILRFIQIFYVEMKNWS